MIFREKEGKLYKIDLPKGITEDTFIQKQAKGKILFLKVNNKDLPKAEDKFIFTKLFYKINNSKIELDMDRIIIAYNTKKIQELKQKRTQDTQNIQVQVQDNIFAGDEESQGRLARAISVLQEDESTIWITENNGAQEVQREDLQEALKLAGQEQTKIWVQYNKSKEEL